MTRARGMSQRCLRQWLTLALAAGCIWAVPPVAAEAPPHEYKLTKPGFNAGNMTQGEFNDSVSTFSGGVTIAATDLRLPGKGGLDLVVTRIYNSKYNPLQDGDVLNQLGSSGVDSSLGLGWRLMVAPELVDTGGDGAANPGPELLLPDGSSVYFYPPAGFDPEADQSVVFRSKGFWKLLYWPSYKAPQILTVYSPTGLRYTYNWYIQSYNPPTQTGGCCPLRADACGEPCLFTANSNFRWEQWCYGANCSVARIHPVMVPASVMNTDGNVIQFFYVSTDMGGQPQSGTSPSCVPGRGFRGRLDHIVDSLGRTITFIYTDDGQPRPQALQQIVAPFHTTTYDVTRVGGFNQLHSVTQGQLQTSYGYYADGSLKSITAPSGAMVNYTWGNQDFDVRIRRDTAQGSETLIRKVTTPVVTLRTVTVNGQPRTTQYIYPKYPQGSSSSDEYHRTRVIDPEGNVTDTYHLGYEAMASGAFQESDIGRVEMVKHYDANLQLLQTEKFQYSSFAITTVETDDLFLQAVYGRGVQKQETYRGAPIPANLITSSSTTSFDAYGNPLTAIVTGVNATAKTITYTYDYCNPFEGGSTIACETGVYVVHGLVKSKTVSGNPDYREEVVNNGRGHVGEHRIKDAQLGDRVTDLTYYTSGTYNGQVQTITHKGDAQNPDRVTTFNAYQWGVPSSVSDTVGTIINQVVRDDGLITSQTDRNNNTTTYEYTAEGLLKKIIPPPNAGAPAPNPATFAAQIIDYDWTVPKITVTQGTNKTIYTYDQLMELKGTEVITGAGSIFTRTDYDRLGRATKTYYPKLNGAISDTDPRTETTYDGLGRPLIVTDIADDTRITKHAYDAPNITRVTDAKNRTTTYDYDGFGRLHMVSDATQHATTYTYNHLDALTAVSQQGDSGITLSRGFTFSPGGLLLSETHPESGTTLYAYNAFGEVMTRTQNGRAIAMTYDGRGRQKTVTYPDHPGMTFTYDVGGSCTKNCADQLVSVTDETGMTNYASFDVLGHPLSKSTQLTYGGNTYTYAVTYGYDTLGRIIQQIYPSNRTLTYTYDDANRLKTMTQAVSGGPVNLISNVTYTAASTPDAITYGNNVTADWTVNKRFRPTRLDLLNSTVPATGLPWSLVYDTYDEMDNLRVMFVNTKKETFGYDALDRLTSAMLEGVPQGTGTMTGSLTYQYDPFGNRLTRTSNVTGIPNQSFTYASNQINGFVYDANGNLTNDGQHTYSFTADNKLRSVDGGAVTYYYNADGHRAITVNSKGVVTFYAYEGGQPVTKWELR